jgi:hypothetical protein
MDEHAAGPEPDRVISDQAAVERAEGLLRHAHVLRLRGDRAGAARLLEEAIAVAPGSVMVLEAQADDLADRRKFAEARDVYAKALEVLPKHPAIERKYAEVVLRQAEAQLPYASGPSVIEETAYSRAGAILSVFLPGLGQIVTGHRNLGLALLIGWIAGWTWAILVPDGIRGLAGLIGLARDAPPPNPLVFLPLLLAAVCHLWAISDAVARAKRSERRKIERPRPPVDKDFEL